MALGGKIRLLQPCEQQKVRFFSFFDLFEDRPLSIDIVELSHHHDSFDLALLHLDHDPTGQFPSHQDSFDPGMLSYFPLYGCRIDLPDVHPLAHSRHSHDLAPSHLSPPTYLDLLYGEIRIGQHRLPQPIPAPQPTEGARAEESEPTTATQTRKRGRLLSAAFFLLSLRRTRISIALTRPRSWKAILPTAGLPAPARCQIFF